MSDKLKKYKLEKELDLPKDEDVSRYKDYGKLMANYEKAAKAIHKKPLYKDPKAFMVLLIILLLAYLISTMSDEKKQEEGNAPATQEQPVNNNN